MGASQRQPLPSSIWTWKDLVNTASRIGRATIDQLFEPDGEWSLIHPRLLPADIREAVSRVDVVVGPDGNTHYKYRLWPKLAALDLIAKLRGRHVVRAPLYSWPSRCCGGRPSRSHCRRRAEPDPNV